MTQNFMNLSETRENVAKKIELTNTLKGNLLYSINNVHTIDDLTRLLDYKATYNQLSELESLYKLKYKALGKNYIPLKKASGRKGIFKKNPEDIVSRFRSSGIIRYRTITVKIVAEKNNDIKSTMLDKICNDWISEMKKWVSSESPKLSNDESKINDIHFDLLDEEKQHSAFSKELLTKLNGTNLNRDTDDLKLIRYVNGEIDSITKNIVVLDFSDKD